MLCPPYLRGLRIRVHVDSDWLGKERCCLTMTLL